MGIKEKLLDVIFPSGIYCISCGSMIDNSRDYALCDTCMRAFHWVGEKTCAKCGKILQDDYSHRLCYDCRQLTRSFDRGFTCVQYGLLERGLLMDFKYRGKAYIGKQLGDILYDRLSAEELRYDLIVPVPMYSGNLNRRGYNQAAVMAARLAARSSTAYTPDLLIRRKKTAAMKGLGAVERYENLKNVFAVSPKNHYTIAGKRILVVDDIFTTGSTLDACSKVLKDAGAAEVHVLTFACGGNIPPKE